MNAKEYLLVKLAEECVEVAQRCTKALTFTLDEIQPGQSDDNAERLAQEFDDLLGVHRMLTARGIIRRPDYSAADRKPEKVMKFAKLSRELGALEGLPL